MTMPRNYESEAFAAVHVKMEGLYHAEAIDKRMLREFGKACLAPATPWHAQGIKPIREAHDVSQPVFRLSDASVLRRWL